MGRVIGFVAALLLVSGCATVQEPIVETEIKYVHVPVLYSPEPPDINRPMLVVDTLTSSSSAGDVAQAYHATVVQLLQYSKRLELVIDQYGIVSDEFKQLREEIEELYPADKVIEQLEEQ